MKNICIIILTVFIFASCEKVINVDHKDNQSKIIIEGNITNQPVPYFVKITRSISLEEAGPNPTINDAIVTISDVNTFMLEIDDDDLKLVKGDYVSITMQCIDKNAGSYYTALAQMADTGPGGGTTPNNPPNNISNGALGIFSAHTVETKHVTIR